MVRLLLKFCSTAILAPITISLDCVCISNYQPSTLLNVFVCNLSMHQFWIVLFSLCMVFNIFLKFLFTSKPLPPLWSPWVVITNSKLRTFLRMNNMSNIQNWINLHGLQISLVLYFLLRFVQSRQWPISPRPPPAHHCLPCPPLPPAASRPPWATAKASQKSQKIFLTFLTFWLGWFLLKKHKEN